VKRKEMVVAAHGLEAREKESTSGVKKSRKKIKTSKRIVKYTIKYINLIRNELAFFCFFSFSTYIYYIYMGYVN
jgi:hypothetical protein